MTRRSSITLHAARTSLCAILTGALLLPAAAAHAQDGANGGEPRYYLGSRLMFSNANVSAGREYDPRFGIGGGVYFGGSVWKQFDLRVEANYVQKGAELSVGSWAIEWQFDYLEIPLVAVYNFHPRSRTSFEICAGMSYGFALAQQLEEGDNLGYDLEEWKGESIPLQADLVDINGVPTPRASVVINELKTTELNAVLGFGLSTPVGAVRLCMDARYVLGLTDPVVSSTYRQVLGDGDDAVLQTVNEDVSNKVWCFYVGFEFPLGSRSGTE
jgi:hypothetical protein